MRYELVIGWALGFGGGGGRRRQRKDGQQMSENDETSTGRRSRPDQQSTLDRKAAVGLTRATMTEEYPPALTLSRGAERRGVELARVLVEAPADVRHLIGRDGWRRRCDGELQHEHPPKMTNAPENATCRACLETLALQITARLQQLDAETVKGETR